MTRIKWFILLLFFVCIKIQAQTSYDTELSGKVTNMGEGVTDVHVLNLTQKRATITNSEGEFLIRAAVNDTLMFSAIQLQRKSLVITPAILSSGYIIVPLGEFVNELDEVVLLPFNLTGDLSRDMNNIETDKVVVASTLGLPNAYVKPITQAERKLFEATTGGGLVPLNPILNAITGRTKYLKKVLAYQEKYARTNRVRDFYADSLFVQNLGIPSDKIEDFMYYCEIDSSFSSVVDTRDRLKIWEYLKRRSSQYLVLSNEE
ncbi:hypothetical protein [Eudoraea chungangensis]|uniref:hypothetical protein n=1 Tax=Eudoraea chungangensis TaxID=1481905 RepID=UPI0023EB4EF7|nr:hypothetical protein [Eudoraea chungangensis]